MNHVLRAGRSILLLALALAFPGAALAQQPTPARPAQTQKPKPSKPKPGPAAAAPAPAAPAEPPAIGGVQPTLLAMFGDWGAYTASPNGKKICFALAKPSHSQTNPPGRPRDPA